MINGTLAIGVGAIAFGVVLSIAFSPSPRQVTGKTPTPALAAQYPYESAQFTKFVAESYRVKGSGSPDEFYTWFDNEFEKVTGEKPAEYLASARERIASAKDDPNTKLEEECNLATDIHHTIKKVIPRFSLQHGFEFYQAKDLGERQCFLQSILVCGLLQRAGLDSGVVMVYKNIAGEATNNGHAVAVARLSNGNDILVDCSDQEPFVEHKGLFMRDGEKDYVYVSPKYDDASGIISGYRQEGTSQTVAPRSLSTLDIAFINSQFDYYRGERTPGGFFETPTNKAGLELSAKYLQKSIAENPKNPLAVYMLGHVYQKLDQSDAARNQYLAAKQLYQQDGWVPPGVRDALGE